MISKTLWRKLATTPVVTPIRRRQFVPDPKAASGVSASGFVRAASQPARGRCCRSCRAWASFWACPPSASLSSSLTINWLSRCLSIAPASQVQEHLRPSSDLTPRLRSRVRWDDFSGRDAVDVRGETQGKRGWKCDASRSQPEGSDRWCFSRSIDRIPGWLHEVLGRAEGPACALHRHSGMPARGGPLYGTASFSQHRRQRHLPVRADRVRSRCFAGTGMDPANQ
jgi:hypothetical protein